MLVGARIPHEHRLAVDGSPARNAHARRACLNFLTHFAGDLRANLVCTFPAQHKESAISADDFNGEVKEVAHAVLKIEVRRDHGTRLVERVQTAKCPPHLLHFRGVNGYRRGFAIALADFLAEHGHGGGDCVHFLLNFLETQD